MKAEIPTNETSPAGGAKKADAAQAGFKLARWQSLADFRARAAHQQTHRPSARIRYALLRDAVFGFALLGSWLLSSASAGTITGIVQAEGKKNPAAGAADDAYASRKYKFLEKVDYAAMSDFVVYIDGVTATNGMSTNVMQVTTARVAQHGAEFTPSVLPVLAGTTVEWPNHDQIFHNVFSVSDAAQFDLGLYEGNPPDKRVTFQQPGKVDVYCSIHQNMHCVVLVMANPYFAATGKDKHYTITNVPAGKYKLKAWGERLPIDQREIIVPETGEVKADFTLTPGKNLPKI
jgi:plastocyanin